MELNSSTLKGRANVAKLTLAGLGAIGLYMKFGPGKKVKAEGGNIFKFISLRFIQFI
jgi:hypothetical protein